MEKQKPLMEQHALNGLSSWSVDDNSELEKKAAEKYSKCGTMGGLDAPSWPRLSVGLVVNSNVFLGRFSLIRYHFCVRTSFYKYL